VYGPLLFAGKSQYDHHNINTAADLKPPSRAFAVRNMEYGHNPVGPDFFGLRKNTIAKMIQDLPNADKCRNYVWQMFEIGRSKQGRGTKRPQATLADDVIHQHQFEQSVARGPIGRIRSVKLNSSTGPNSTLYPMRSDNDNHDEDDEEDEMDEDE
jgi:F/Y rich C-terminus